MAEEEGWSLEDMTEEMALLEIQGVAMQVLEKKVEGIEDMTEDQAAAEIQGVAGAVLDKKRAA